MLDGYLERLGLSTLQIIGAFPGQNPDFAGARPFLDAVGVRLFLANLAVYTRLLTGVMTLPNGQLRSPLAGRSPYPASLAVSGGLEFDLHMVVYEQTLVQEMLNEARELPDGAPGHLSSSQIAAINLLLNMSSHFEQHGHTQVGALVDGYNGDDRFLQWASSNLLSDVDFENIDHRIAMGVARVFQEHGLSRSDYLLYMQTGVLPLILP